MTTSGCRTTGHDPTDTADSWAQVITQGGLMIYTVGAPNPQKNKTKTLGEEMERHSEAAAAPHVGQRMLFTGPGGIGDYRPRSNYSPRSIGVGASSPEATGDLGYLCRAAPQGGGPPTPRHSHVGEVGWGWQYNQLLNSGVLLSNMQIKRTEVRTALEDRVTQRFQGDQ
ncbi:spmip2 [Pungitius sinensis]